MATGGWHSPGTGLALACGDCNQKWKRNLFPVCQQPRPACVEGAEGIEQPLLLDPGSAFHTRQHFSWTMHGEIKGLSDEGRATIITCGLNRRALRIAREKIALDIWRALNELDAALLQQDNRSLERARRRLVELTDDTAEFASMTRWFVEEAMDEDWAELDFSS